MFASNTRHCFPVSLFAFWLELPFLTTGRNLITVCSGIYAPLFSQGEQAPDGLLGARPASNILWINNSGFSITPDKATYLVSGTGSPALRALYSSQSIILAGFFLLPTETKLLKLQNQENFPLSFCSIIPTPEAMSMEYLKFLNERNVKGYQRMLGKNSHTNTSKCDFAICVKDVSVGC